MEHTNEVNLVVRYADHQAGGETGQLVIDDVSLTQSRDNRNRHGIGNDDPQWIEKGNNTYTFSTTAFLSDASAAALKRIERGDAVSDAIHITDTGTGNTLGKASGMVFNELTVESSDGGDSTVSIDADLPGVDWQ